MNLAQRRNGAPLVAGSLFIAAGIFCNRWLLAALFSPDGQIEDSRFRVLVILVQVVLACIGAVILILRPKLRRLLAAAAGGLVLAIVAAGAFFWGWAAAGGRHVFPHQQARWLARAVGLDQPAPPEELRVDSRSAAWQELRALPYLSGKLDPDKEFRGVLVHEREKVSPGLNFYNPSLKREAFLMDMDGKVLHRWSHPSEPWHHAELLANGEVLVVAGDDSLIKLDFRSRLLWALKLPVHHDLWIGPEDRIYTLTRRGRLVPELHPEVEVLEDFITVVSPTGVELEELSLLEALRESPYRFLLPSVSHLDPVVDFGWEAGEGLDLLHTNHIEVFDGRFASRSPIFARGNLLVSMRNVNALAILDGRSREIIWLWGPSNLSFQHHPTLLPNAHLLIFNNGTERSSVLELDLVSQTIVWRYAPESGFFSATRGSNQRLDNGNTLITDSDTGYVFEVTPEGELVWKFANPDVTEEGERGAIWRMTRFRPEALSLPAR